MIALLRRWPRSGQWRGRALGRNADAPYQERSAYGIRRLVEAQRRTGVRRDAESGGAAER